jgi:hypothetical protein
MRRLQCLGFRKQLFLYNQILSKLNPYTGEVLESWPLLTAPRETQFVFPSGLIPAGVFKDKYKYILESDPQVEYLSDSEDGRFKWIATTIDSNKDIRGILAFKDNLYVTMSEYSAPIEDRFVTPTGFAVGKVLMYSNNHTFEHYIPNYGMTFEPTQLVLSSEHNYPTDITVYEDGSIFIADYLNTSGLYQYKFAYDYALIRSSYDQDSLVLLRENYEDGSI